MPDSLEFSESSGKFSTPLLMKLLSIPRSTTARFYDFEEFARVVEAAKADGEAAYLIVLLGGEAGMRCGEIMTLKGHVTASRCCRQPELSSWHGSTP